MSITKSILYLLTVLILSSCSAAKKIIYIQDEQIGVKQQVTRGSDITIQPQDQLSIAVSSKNPELTSVFNQTKTTLAKIENSEPLIYTVRIDGYIDFPVLGMMKIQGLTREQVANLIKASLVENLVKDAVVTVEFVNMNFFVLGEVDSPGKYRIVKDQITILEALSEAGDLTIFGLRDKVFLIRTAEDRITYQLDLTSSELFNSPAFYVQQNDVIYVEPNKMRANQSTINGNTAKSVSLWMSITSLLMTASMLFFR